MQKKNDKPPVGYIYAVRDDADYNYSDIIKAILIKIPVASETDKMLRFVKRSPAFRHASGLKKREGYNICRTKREAIQQALASAADNVAGAKHALREAEAYLNSVVTLSLLADPPAIDEGKQDD